MNAKVILPIILAIATFLIGYFFFAKSQGQLECSSKLDSTNANKNGGIAGMSLAGVLLLVALFFYVKARFDITVVDTRPSVTQM